MSLNTFQEFFICFEEIQRLNYSIRFSYLKNMIAGVSPPAMPRAASKGTILIKIKR